MNSALNTTLLKYVKRSCLALVAIAAILATPGMAADTPTADEQQTAMATSSGTVSSENDILSVTFQKDTSIREALRYLAAKYQKNIIPSPKVDGILTVSTLYDVTFDEAMKAILGNNFVYEESGNFINVYGAEEYRKMKEDPSRLQTRVFTLYYISADEAMKLLEPVTTARTICPECIVKGSAAVEKIAPTGEDISTGSSSGNSNALNDMLVVKDYPEKLDMIEAKLREIDIRPLQVLVEATILSVKLNEDTKFGIDWNTLQGVAISTLSGVYASGGGAGSTGISTLSDTTSQYSIGITSEKVVAIINAIETVTDTTVLANPRILAINKQMGQVYIGRKLGYRDQTTTGVNGEVISGQVSFLKTGTKLSFRPYIGNDGFIRMDIYPKDSTGVVEDGIPNETSAELSTNIMLKDGQTVIIGGLLRKVVTTSKSQVPVLGDLPLIGIAFRGSSDSVERQEVVVMLTPHIIKTPADASAEQALADVENKLDGANKQMQWFSRSRIAEDHYQNALQAYNSGDMKKALREVNMSLEIRPTYTEALRLQKQIMAKESANAGVSLENVMQEAM